MLFSPGRKVAPGRGPEEGARQPSGYRQEDSVAGVHEQGKDELREDAGSGGSAVDTQQARGRKTEAVGVEGESCV